MAVTGSDSPDRPAPGPQGAVGGAAASGGMASRDGEGAGATLPWPKVATSGLEIGPGVGAAWQPWGADLFVTDLGEEAT